MSWGALHWALEQDIEDGIAKFLLVILCERASPETLDLYRTIPNLARDTSQSERTVQRKLKWLVDEGYIRRLQDFDPATGRQRANDYVVLAPDSVKRGQRDGAGARKAANPTAGRVTDSHPHGADPVLDDRPRVTDSHREGDAAVTGEGDSTVTPKTPTTTIPTTTDSSEPDGSAPRNSAAIRDFRKELFERGVSALAGLTGRPASRCRTLIGSWLKLVADEAVSVLRAIDDAVEAEAIDPVGWIEARLKRPAAGGWPAAATTLSPDVLAMRHAEASRMAARGEWPVGGTVFVDADSGAGRAWEEHFRAFDRKPRWRQYRDGWGGYMPTALPPTIPARVGGES